jgi:hypothetical protein
VLNYPLSILACLSLVGHARVGLGDRVRRSDSDHTTPVSSRGRVGRGL